MEQIIHFYQFDNVSQSKGKKMMFAGAQPVMVLSKMKISSNRLFDVGFHRFKTPIPNVIKEKKLKLVTFTQQRSFLDEFRSIEKRFSVEFRPSLIQFERVSVRVRCSK